MIKYKDAFQVVGLPPDDFACGNYRVKNFIRIAQSIGVEAEAIPHLNAFTLLQKHDPNKANILLVSRPVTQSVYECIKYAQWHGWIVVYDIDDDLMHVPKSNPAHDYFKPGGDNYNRIKRMLRESNGVIASTPELAHSIVQYNSNIHVIDNYMDLSLRDFGFNCTQLENGQYKLEVKETPIPENRNGKFVVGYSGGNSHLQDLLILKYGLTEFLNHNPDTLFAMNSSKELFDLFTKDLKVDKRQLLHVPAVPFNKHPEVIQHCHVQLAPLPVDQFNQCKTNLKAKEALTSGSLVIASCIAPYARLHHKYPEYITLVGDNKFSERSWYSALTKVKNMQNINNLRLKAKLEMAEKESLELHYPKYFNVFKTIIDNQLEGNLGPLSNVNKDLFKLKLTKKDKCLITGKNYKEGYTYAWT